MQSAIPAGSRAFDVSYEFSAKMPWSSDHLITTVGGSVRVRMKLPYLVYHECEQNTVQVQIQAGSSCPQ
jgi:hypothetical protein